MATKEQNLNRLRQLALACWGARRICPGVLRILLNVCLSGKRSLLFPGGHYEL